MPTIEFPREGWVERLNAFTIAHEGWTASLEVFGPETRQQPAVVNLPLIGVSADRVDHDGTVAISVALSASEASRPIPLLAINDHHSSDMVVAHASRRVCDGLVRCGSHYHSRTHVTYSHGCPP